MLPVANAFAAENIVDFSIVRTNHITANSLPKEIK